MSHDDEVAAAPVPPITAVRPDEHRLGVLAMELALARLEAGPGRPVHRISLWPQVIVRESCGHEGAGPAADSNDKGLRPHESMRVKDHTFGT